ncbi:DNA-binding domain-containing protein [Antarcticimicrobium luteum]|uniref:DUF2063 domain-containing protein n=1 Tax=Antarcticimicrobium luteum TaxID=2547397 RepID=A0A4R5UQ61_9RHOB|nr:DNA-binding domain-containing protein [Antarcticimicrobium luteum]TDK41001.1 DUF2063 domain-containing protein [Antarcticimicrobium luteum]
MSVSQTDFRAALLDADRPAPTGLQDAAARPAGRRFDVYRNNVAVSLTEALHDGFPAVASLLGKTNMDGIAGMFLRAHPPASPLLMLYGEAFPDFLAGLEQLSHLGYLADVARLELALRQSYHAADAAPIPPERLGQTAPEALLAARLALAPALRLRRSPWPVFDIWRYATEPGAPQPQAAAQDVLITRPGYDPAPQPLPPGGAAWIAALQTGQSWGAAEDAARAEAAGFDLTPTLTLLLQGGAITDLMTEG